MKKLIIFVLSLFLISCSSDSESEKLDYKNEMRNFVIGISEYAKNQNPNFAIIPQNGIQLVTEDGEINGALSTNYLNAIDGNGQEDFLYGYDNDDIVTPIETTSYLENFLSISKNFGNKILVTDYCSTPSKMTNSYNQNTNYGYVSFAADQRSLNNIPAFPNPIHNENANVITNLNQIQNFIFFINPENYATKTDFINAVTATNYDAIIMDLFFNDGSEFTVSEILQLKNKANGGKRIVISYMSIGEAENYRYYWQNSWNGANKPSFLDTENPNWQGNYKVKYWKSEWKQIIYGNEGSYLKKILDSGFDGVYLDIIDAFEYYEN